MVKFFTLLILLAFAWWRFKRWWRVRQLKAQGQPVPEETGIRPITLLSIVLLGVYGGFLLWHLFGQPQ
ncbi:hypothetical protein LRB11_04290 [Ectothiorhodospira haloalkaliphila]|uniref:hypothetical protein n=1 Tax=Ectothiorhodospira haloalkaliphila TaxID=421628 RepID=UPI001EE8B0B3|nr:hypothetical protein [Ectothiorhodospira haloalkaliphila]MCG5524152.1 hypothetical protein [Ectothiorhodospira haloalkaliphila]